MMEVKFSTVDEYIESFPPDVKSILKDLRRAIRQTAPKAEEVISYNMPAYKFHGILVYFAGHKNHIGFYPGSGAITGIFKDSLAGYKTSKGTVQLPMDKPLPLRLIKDIVKYRIKENLEREKA
ncbi:MAG: iron chaperone, partial [Syntrophomonadaceae bacterium]